MQVEHVLFFKLKEISPAKWQELHAAAMTLKTIPGVLGEYYYCSWPTFLQSSSLDVNFGPSFTTDRTKGYTHGFRVKFAVLDARARSAVPYTSRTRPL